MQELYKELERNLRRTDLRVGEKYLVLNSLFDEILNAATSTARVGLSGKFSKLHYLSEHYRLANQDYLQLNAMRRRLAKSETTCKSELQTYLSTDVTLLSRLWQIVSGVEIPPSLQAYLSTDLVVERQKDFDSRCRRVVVQDWTDTYLLVQAADANEESLLKVWLRSEDGSSDWSSIVPLLRCGSQLNLIATHVRDNGVEAHLIVFEPDYLVDVTAVANCFQDFGVSTHIYALSRLSASPSGVPLLLGNFASQMLDEAVHRVPKDYAESVQQFFLHNALSIATCEDFSHIASRQKFHHEARRQQTHLHDMVSEQFSNILHLNCAEEVLLEPSFFCEQLGLQGRMDLLSTDWKRVVEQKSGKQAFPTGGAKLAHRVQMLLYMAILHYAHGVRYSDLSAHLLYSKYAGREGLLRMQNSPQLLQKSMQIRNEMVAREFQFAEVEHRYFDELELSEIGNNGNTLWERYKRPEYESLLDVFRKASPLSKKYFYRFHRFLSLEHRLAKLGSSQRESSGFASAWHATLYEKQQAGNIICPLRIAQNGCRTDARGAVVELELEYCYEASAMEVNTTPNFRLGDIVMLYAYDQPNLPDLRKTMVMRATIESIDAHRILLHLRAPQTNVGVFEQTPATRWALEPDFIESGSASLIRGLYAFLTGTQHWRSLLLAERRAVVTEPMDLCCEHPNEELNQLVKKAKQARDFFLLIGPPGTGKTSMGLMSLLREELFEPSAQVLLAAFTNRAVDEICSKLVKDGIDFVRIGNVWNCDVCYRKYLVSERVSGLSKLDEVESLLRTARVIVGTTASLSANIAFVSDKRFSLAIIDEASQLLEPHLLPLIMAEKDGRNSIERFVLIGDHKQLPAVVQQSEIESRVCDDELRKIGLTDCRRSLFERLLTLLPESCIHRFTRHGRMHPEVADFVNRYFYGGSLVPIPLAHQKVQQEQARVLFYDCRPQSDAEVSPKTNQTEARLIAQIAQSIYAEVAENGTQFRIDHDLGIIVPYRHQIALIRNELRKSSYPDLAGVAIDTVERFQGSERETIIYGFTVSRQHQLKFLCNSQFVDEDGVLIDRKLNVVLTRARQRTIVVGNAELLSEVPLFARLINEVAINNGHSLVR